MADNTTDATLEGLISSIQNPMQQFSPLGQLGAGLAGFGAGVRGQENPVFAEARARVGQQLDVMKLQQAVEKMRTEREQIGINFYKSVLDDPHATKDSQLWATKGWTGSLKRIGVPISPELEQAVATRRVTLSDLGEIGKAKAMGVPDALLQDQYKSMTPEEFQAGVQLSQNDLFLKANKLPTQTELTREALTNRQKDMELLLKDYGIHGDNPRSQYTLQQSVAKFGKPFSGLEEAQRQQILKESEGFASPKTTLVKNALSAAGLNPDQVQDPVTIQKALTAYEAKKQQMALERASTLGQLTAMGGAFKTEIGRANVNMDRIKRLDILADDADRLIKEGKQLGITTNPRLLNIAMQELALWTGNPKNKLGRQAEWVRAFAELDARYASVAQGLEGVTGNRLAQTLAQKALGFHPKVSDPYNVQTRILQDLRRATRQAQDAAHEDMARTIRQYQGAADAAGVNFILQGVQGGSGFTAEREAE